MYSIYVVTNLVNDKMYVGQSHKPRARWSAHKSDARRNSPHPLHNAIRKYGEKSFSFDVLLEVETQQQADYQEQMWIILLGAHRSKGGYVVSRDGKGHLGHTTEDLKRRGLSLSKSISLREGPHWSRRTDVSPELVVRMYYEEGKSSKTISQELKCSVDIVHERLKEAGRPIGCGNHSQGYTRPDTSRSIDTDVLFGMYQQGYSTTRISRALDCSTTLIRQRLIKAGVTPRTNKESLEIRKSLPAVTWARSEEANQRSSAALSKAWREGRHVGNTLTKKTPPNQLSA